MAYVSYQYDESTLKRLQNVELEILKAFDAVCLKYGLTYFAVFGTAIGAVRHHGFIPWDDDIDLGMMLSDYKKLCEVPDTEWEQYGLQFISPEDEFPTHQSAIGRLYKTGTIFEGVKRVRYDKPKGWPNHPKRPIWLDIFIYNHVDSPEMVKSYQDKMMKLHRLYWYAKSGMQIKRDDNLLFQVRCLRNDLIHKLLNVWPHPELGIYRKFRSIQEKLDSGTGKYVTLFGCDEKSEMMDSLSKEEDMFPVVRIPFEDTNICIQKNYDEMLTALYGNYMEIPPKEKQVNHGAAILDFGDGLGNVIKYE